MKPKTKDWLDIAQEDYEVAEHLLVKKKYLHCLFFCQQSIEKALKALYYEKYKKTPPRKHDLMALADAAGLSTELDQTTSSILDMLSQYYIESMYVVDRESLAKKFSASATKYIFVKTGDIKKWLENELK